jgi:tRNA G18 (ribose-2'-O)-methylase SpoU
VPDSRLAGRVTPIDDPADERVADYRHLTDHELRRAVEQPEGGPGVFIAEGVLAIRALLRSPYPVRSVLLTQNRLADLEGDLAGTVAPVYVAGQPVMDVVAGFPIHRGAVAAGQRLPLPDQGEVLAGARAVAVLEGLNDHENVGVIFRAAAALGVDGVLLSPTCCDPLYRRAVRVSLGHVLHVPFTRVEPWPTGLGEVRAAGFTLVALTPDPTADRIDDPDACTGPTAVLVGSEGTGLSAGALAAADRRVRIPMRPGVDSLNVGTAAAIAFHRLTAPLLASD